MHVLSKDIVSAASLIKEGKIIAFPTETVYGLGVCLSQKDAVENLYRLKNRSNNKPLALHAHDVSGLKEWVDHPIFFRLAEAFLPGPLSIVIHSKKTIPHWVNALDKTISIRVPDHPLAQEFLREVQEPIVATSANLSGCPSALSAQDVQKAFPKGVDLILDGGVPKYCLESTIVKIEGNQLILLRQGVVSQLDIEKIYPLTK